MADGNVPAHMLERSRKRDPLTVLKDLGNQQQAAQKAASLGLRDAETDITRPEQWQYDRATRTAQAKAIGDVQKECWQISEDHGFHDVGQTPGDKLMLIVSEAAEALEDIRDGHGLNEVWYEGKDGTKPCGVPSEIADIVIRCFDAAECWDFDLGPIIMEKMAFNRTRPHLHGRTM